jgi:uncharacterized protein YndB with AHSA1/START domain
MSLAIKPAPVKKTRTVATTPERAFAVFTAGFNLWWPRTHSTGEAPLKTAVIEPRKGGRWYGLLENGTEAEWGDVLAWQPPTRLLLAWRINAEWTYDRNLLTEVEVVFAPEGEGATRINFEHRLLENMGAQGEGARAAFDSEGGWSGLLQLFAAEAAKAS